MIQIPTALVKSKKERRVIQMGPYRCKIREWVRLPDCFICQKVGHRAHGCTEKAKVEGKRCYHSHTDHGTYGK